MATIIKSPCIDICSINKTNHLCEGCFRTIEEIARWQYFTDTEKYNTLNACAERKLRIKMNP